MSAAGEWVQAQLDADAKYKASPRRRRPVQKPAPELSAFHHRVLALVSKSFRTGIHNVRVAWDRQDWRHDNMLILTVRDGGRMATWDFDALTRFVIGAHDECIRFAVEPVGLGYIRLCFWQRGGREGPMHSRHPTIETAIEDFRR